MATRIRPNCIGGRDLGIEYPLLEQYRVQKERYFELAEIRRKQRSQRRTGYDRDWGDAIVDQQLSDDPGPINAGTFQPVKRWIVVYRTTPGGLDGTHNITVGDIRDAITGTTATPTLLSSDNFTYGSLQMPLVLISVGFCSQKMTKITVSLAVNTVTLPLTGNSSNSG